MAVDKRVGSAALQGRLWGQRPLDWAEIQEDTVLPVFREVADHFAGPGVEVLDIGCGSGRFVEMATAAGCRAVGIDATEALLEIAAGRTPAATFREAEMEDLPFSSASFDLVTGFNSFQYAADPVAALREARRVVRPGGHVVAMVWGTAEECEAAAYLAALGRLMPPAPPGAPGPFAISQPGALETLIREAGLAPERRRVVQATWTYSDLETALRGLLSAGPARRAAENSGDEAAVEAVSQAIAPCRRADGTYVLLNHFHYVVASAT